MKVDMILGDLPSLPLIIHTDCILYDLDATSVRMTEMVEELWTNYPYAQVRREKIPYKNRAVKNDRGHPGDIAYGEPLDFYNQLGEELKQPHLIGLISQFAVGEAAISGKKKRKHSKDAMLADPHYFNGLTLDTEEQRRQWFRRALRKAVELILKNSGKIRRIIYPYGLGMSCAQYINSCNYDLWESKYLPLLGRMEQYLKPQGITFLMVCPVLDSTVPHPPSHGMITHKMSAGVASIYCKKKDEQDGDDDIAAEEPKASNNVGVIDLTCDDVVPIIDLTDEIEVVDISTE